MACIHLRRFPSDFVQSVYEACINKVVVRDVCEIDDWIMSDAASGAYYRQSTDLPFSHMRYCFSDENTAVLFKLTFE